MAGIGFVLRKLLKKNDITGIVQAYLHATLASSGPWLFTVLALGSFFMITGGYISNEILENFRVVLLYNFAFSLVISAPFTIVSTRYLADLIYREDVEDAPAMLLGTLVVLNLVALPVVTSFYLYFTNLSAEMVLYSTINFILIAGIWQVSIFISAIKQYTGVTFSFVFGMIIAVFAAIYFADFYSEEGMINGFNIGLAFIFSSLVALVFAEYPKKCTFMFRVVPYFRNYWELAAGALLYSIGIWADKWIMWFAPEATQLPVGLIMYPHYDSAMFVAYLTVVPAMSMFLISQETAFFEEYVNFFEDIQKHANYDKIEHNHQSLMNCLFEQSRGLLLLQGSICFMTILAAPKIFDLLGMNYIQLGMFRFGVLGAMFQVFVLFLTVILSYFDHRRGVLKVQAFFCFSNIGLSFLSREMGFAYYGYGYFLSNLLTFILATYYLERYLRFLPYHTFVTNNASVTSEV